MSGLFSSPKRPKITTVEEAEPIRMVEEDAETARRRERRRLMNMGGRTSTIISGIRSALKKRLGE